jgi:osmoprotectant transport system permease protein
VRVRSRTLPGLAALVLGIPLMAVGGPGSRSAVGRPPPSGSPATARGAPVDSGPRDRAPVVVASKPFAESYILAEMFAQVLEARGIAVRRRLGLGATAIAFAALRAGDIDVYPEYTGTGLVAILGEKPPSNGGEAFRRVSIEFRARWGVRWLPPLGFQNTTAIAVRRATADSLHLATLSDLARVSRSLVGGFSPDFLGRPDGLPGLERAYGLHMGQTRALLQAVKYRALAAREVDVIDGYGTDGQIARYDLVVLADDKHFFPPYDAAPLVSRHLADDRPDAVAALSELGGMLDEAHMRALNRRVEVDGEDAAVVAHDALASLGLVPDTVRPAPAATASAGARVGGTGAGAGAASSRSLPAYLWSHRYATARQTLRHLLLVVLSLGGGILVAVPLGLWLERVRRSAEGVIRAVGLLQTLPSIALLAFMIPVLGIGVGPAVVALFLYSLYPIVRNTYSGVRDADPVAVDAARALGMTDAQVLTRVRLPLAAPVIMAGIRTAAVIDVGTATLAAFIGAGGLGDPIVAGLALSDTNMILSGAIPAALLALVVDGTLSLAEGVVRPRGLSRASA